MAMQLPVPILPTGFRFQPTDEELAVNYLQRRTVGQLSPIPIIADVDIYSFNPWELPSMALLGEHEWYFFTPRDHRYPNSVRPNHSAPSGFWRAIGTDKPIQVGGVQDAPIATRKSLVFYIGRTPMEIKTTWIMHEYRLTNTRGATISSSPTGTTPYPNEWVLCKIFNNALLPDNSPPTNVARSEGHPPSPLGNPLPVGFIIENNNNMLFPIQEGQEGTFSQAHQHHQPVPAIFPNLEPPGTGNNPSLNGVAAAVADNGRLDEEDTSAYTFSDQEMEQMLMDLMDQDFFKDEE
uniref:NAC domain-containing protein n=1 Tax=Leersia perrieri TaxID=77586 RepID=A0A0D9WGJ0_9ORYZ